MYWTSSTEKAAASTIEYKTWGRSFYIQDAIEYKNLTFTPGFRYEKIDAKRIKAITNCIYR